MEEEYLKGKQELSPEEGKEELDQISQEYLDRKQRLESSLNEELYEAIR